MEHYLPKVRFKAINKYSKSIIRYQFPVKLSFSLGIDEAENLPFDKIGFDLRNFHNSCVFNVTSNLLEEPAHIKVI